MCRKPPRCFVSRLYRGGVGDTRGGAMELRLQEVVASANNEWQEPYTSIFVVGVLSRVSNKQIILCVEASIYTNEFSLASGSCFLSAHYCAGGRGVS